MQYEDSEQMLLAEKWYPSMGCLMLEFATYLPGCKRGVCEDSIKQGLPLYVCIYVCVYICVYTSIYIYLDMNLSI